MSRCYLLAMLIMLLAPLGALAQEEQASGDDASAAQAEAAAMPAANYSRYEAAGFGFSVELPDGGIITDPSDPEWNEEPTAAFKWQATGDEPITLIIGRVDSFNTAVDELTFSIVCGTMLESWEEDKEAYQVVTANDELRIPSETAEGGEQVWNLIEVADSSNGQGKTVYYSVFSTYAGENIYTIMMYYLQPVNATIRNFGIPVIHEFKIVNQPAES